MESAGNAHSKLAGEKAAVEAALIDAASGKEAAEKLGAELGAQIAELGVVADTQLEYRQQIEGACRTLKVTACIVNEGTCELPVLMLAANSMIPEVRPPAQDRSQLLPEMVQE